MSKKKLNKWLHRDIFKHGVRHVCFCDYCIATPAKRAEFGSKFDIVYVENAIDDSGVEPISKWRGQTPKRGVTLRASHGGLGTRSTDDEESRNLPPQPVILRHMPWLDVYFDPTTNDSEPDLATVGERSLQAVERAEELYVECVRSPDKLIVFPSYPNANPEAEPAHTEVGCFLL
jgi:hypothetical protein